MVAFKDLNVSCIVDFLSLIREDLCVGDFGTNMRLLQNTSEHIPDIQTVIHKAEELRKRDEKQRKNPPIGKRLKNSFRAVGGFSRNSLNSYRTSVSKSVNSTASKLNASVSHTNEKVKKHFLRKNNV